MAITVDAAVVTRVKTLAAAAARPVLDDAEVTGAILAHPMPDRWCLTVEDDDWEQTWDINAAVAELWDTKAGKVAGDFNFKADEADYSKGDVLAHCLEMSAQYASKVAGSVSTADYPDDLRGVVVNG